MARAKGDVNNEASVQVNIADFQRTRDSVSSLQLILGLLSPPKTSASLLPCQVNKLPPPVTLSHSCVT